MVSILLAPRECSLFRIHGGDSAPGEYLGKLPDRVIALYRSGHLDGLFIISRVMQSYCKKPVVSPRVLIALLEQAGVLAITLRRRL